MKRRKVPPGWVEIALSLLALAVAVYVLTRSHHEHQNETVILPGGGVEVRKK